MSTPYLSSYTGAEADEGIRRAYLAYDFQSDSYSGIWDVVEGYASGSVMGLNLPFVPTRIQATLECPDDQDALILNVIGGTLTADGFAYKLSASAVGLYRIHYTLLADSGGDSSNG